MSDDSTKTADKIVLLDFDHILPDNGLLYYEECPIEFQIEKPRLLPLKTSTQIRYEHLQQEAARLWKDKQKEAKKKL